MSNTNDNSNDFNLQPYSPGELARLYNVSQYTMRKWIRMYQAEVGKRVGRYYNIKQVKTIVRQLGLPGSAADE